MSSRGSNSPSADQATTPRCGCSWIPTRISGVRHRRGDEPVFVDAARTDIAPGLPGAGRVGAAPAFTAGDTITAAVDGTPVATYADLITALSGVADKPVDARPSAAGRSRAGASGSPSRRAAAQPARDARPGGDGRTDQGGAGYGPRRRRRPAAFRSGDRLVFVEDGEPAGDLLTLDARLRAKAGQTVAVEITGSDAATRTIEPTPRQVTWIEEPRWPASPVSVPAIGIAAPADRCGRGGCRAGEPGGDCRHPGSWRAGGAGAIHRAREPDRRRQRPGTDARIAKLAICDGRAAAGADHDEGAAGRSKGGDGLDRDVELSADGGSLAGSSSIVAWLFEPVYAPREGGTL